MKTKWKASFVLAGLILAGANARAMERTGWERPILRARMDVLQARPEFSKARNVELVMTKQDGAKDPTGFVLLIDGQPMHFEVVQKYIANCDDAAYVAVPREEPHRITIHSLRLKLVNRTHPVCVALQDVRSDGWQVTLDDLNEELMAMVGEPEAVATIQNW